MKLIERIATVLDLIGIPTGSLCPGNFIADVSASFVVADELAKGGVHIEGRTMSTADFVREAQGYVGLDLVSEALEAEVHSGSTVRDFAIGRAHRLIECQTSHPEFYRESIAELTTDILNAQRRFAA